MPNISVYVNDDLKRRMDAEKDENWSKLASASFNKKLAELIQRKTVNDMEAAIQRLRASRNEYEEMINAEGFEAGKEWAERYADFGQLKRLCEFGERLESEPVYGWEFFFGEDSNNAYCASERLVFEIEGEEPDRNLASDFWDAALGNEDLPEADFARAFAEGAIEFFKRVSDKL